MRLQTGPDSSAAVSFLFDNSWLVKVLMDQQYDKEIEEIIHAMKCPKDFTYDKPGFDVLCKARDIGKESFILCLEKRPLGCKFLSIKDGYLCKCPFRIYLAKKTEEVNLASRGLTRRPRK